MLILEDSRPLKMHALAFSPDGRSLASVTGRATDVCVWNLDTRTVCSTLECNRRVVSVAFSPDGERLATASSAGEICFWSLSPALPIRTVAWERNCTHAVVQVAFSPDGHWLATNMDDRARLLNAKGYLIHFVSLDGTRRSYPTGHWKEVSCLAWSPDGRLLTGSFDRRVHLHDVEKQETVPLDLGKKVHYIAFAPDGATFAAGSPQGLVKVWDARTCKKHSTLKGQARPLHALCYSPDGRTIATASGEGTVAFWDVATSRSRIALDWGIGEVYAVAFAPDGMRAAAGGVGKIVIWDIDDWDP